MHVACQLARIVVRVANGRRCAVTRCSAPVGGRERVAGTPGSSGALAAASRWLWGGIRPADTTPGRGRSPQLAARVASLGGRIPDPKRNAERAARAGPHPTPAGTPGEVATDETEFPPPDASARVFPGNGRVIDPGTRHTPWSTNPSPLGGAPKLGSVVGAVEQAGQQPPPASGPHRCPSTRGWVRECRPLRRHTRSDHRESPFTQAPPGLGRGRGPPASG